MRPVKYPPALSWHCPMSPDHCTMAGQGSVLTRGGTERPWGAGHGLRAALRAEGASWAPAPRGRGWAQAVGAGVVVQVKGAGRPRCRHTEPA